MSARGSGGGRGHPRRDQPSPAPQTGRGGGGGRGRGRGRGRGSGDTGSAGFQEHPPSPLRQPPTAPPVQSTTYASPSSSTFASTSSSSLSREFEKKLTVESPAKPVQPSAQPAQPLRQQPPSSSKDIRVPPRPGYGKEGRKCTIRANHFLVEVADRDLHHYDVEIKPEVTNKTICRKIVTTLVSLFRASHFGNMQLAYDGRKSAYTAGPLPFSSKEFVIPLADEDRGRRREREFKVSIKFAAKADLHHLQQFLAGRQRDVPQETIQALDVVLRATSSINYTVVGRSFFDPVFGAGGLDNGLEYWKGFYQSLRPTQMGLSLNIDMSARAFFEPIPVSEFIHKYFNREPRSLSDQDRLKVKKTLKNVRVEFRNGDYMRRYKVSSLSTQPLSQLTFHDDSGMEISVVQYFRRKYNIALRYTHLPALNAGTEAKPIYLPMEICKIVDGQRYIRKLNERQVSNLLKATCERPHLREASISKMVRHNSYNTDEIVNDFGIHVRAEFASIEARILTPPMLRYHATGREAQVEPRVGQWNMINKKMINGGTVDYWTLVNFSRLSSNDVDRFCHELVSMCCSKGMVFAPQPLLPIQSANPNNIEKALVDIHSHSIKNLEGSGKCIQLLIIILPDFSGSYGRIKRVCETELGIVSQCSQPKQAAKCNKQYLENLSLKINVKVGGRNTVLASALERRIPFVTDRPTIIFGADVTHPAAGEDSSPSIAAVVASMDWPEVTKYRGLVSAQGHRDEIIKDLYKTESDPVKGISHRGMIRELLIAFRKSTGHKPHRIIFYRDGVSEGQFSQVLLEEMDAIRKACVSLEENYLPPVTFVVVQKRHHTRLFPARHDDPKMTDRSGNILPGTVVDTDICHPTEFDFYLCSHAGIQGTSRPTHYHVLYDENKFSADALQSLTNNLCYTYARCTRSVSIVPPAYYAHLAAFRARYYIEGDVSEAESTAGGRATREGGNIEVRQLPAVRENVKDVMFYV